MKYIYFKDTAENHHDFGLFFPEPANIFEEELQRRIFANCREHLNKYLRTERPSKIRDVNTFGTIYNPDDIILDDGSEKRVIPKISDI